VAGKSLAVDTRLAADTRSHRAAVQVVWRVAADTAPEQAALPLAADWPGRAEPELVLARAPAQSVARLKLMAAACAAAAPRPSLR
jgi:hypothetical protein